MPTMKSNTASLSRAAAVLGSITTEAKADAARENGHLGGRPRQSNVHDCEPCLSHGTYPLGDTERHRVFIRFLDGRPSREPGDCLDVAAAVAAKDITGRERSGWAVQARTVDGEWVRAIYTNRHVGDGFGRSGLRRA